MLRQASDKPHFLRPPQVGENYGLITPPSIKHRYKLISMGFDSVDCSSGTCDDCGGVFGFSFDSSVVVAAESGGAVSLALVRLVGTDGEVTVDIDVTGGNATTSDYGGTWPAQVRQTRQFVCVRGLRGCRRLMLYSVGFRTAPSWGMPDRAVAASCGGCGGRGSTSRRLCGEGMYRQQPWGAVDCCIRLAQPVLVRLQRCVLVGLKAPTFDLWENVNEARKPNFWRIPLSRNRKAGFQSNFLYCHPF